MTQTNTNTKTRLYDGETFEHAGLTFRVSFPYDTDAEPPWSREEGHGPVSDWVTRDKRPGERVLSTDRNHKRCYDFAAAVALARKDGWDTEPYGQGTAGERAVRAAEADYQRLRAWCADEWQYTGVVVRLLDIAGDSTRESESLWGIESDDYDYLAEVARELAGEIAERVTGDRVCQVVRK